MEQVDVLDLASRQELSPAQVQELTYLQLQKLCADKGLGGRGTKDELRHRLRQYYARKRARRGSFPADQAQLNQEQSGDTEEAPSIQEAGPEVPLTPLQARTPQPLSALVDRLTGYAHSVQRQVSRFSNNAASYVHNLTPQKSNSRRASLGSTQRRNSKRRNAKQLWYKNKDLLLPVLGTLTALLLAFAAYKAWDSIEPGLNATRQWTAGKAREGAATTRHLGHEAKDSVVRQGRQIGAYWGGIPSQIHRWFSSARARLPRLFSSTDQYGTRTTPRCNGHLNFTSLDTVLDHNPAWDGLRETVHEVCDGMRLHPTKGLGMLLATATATAPDVVTAVRQSLLLGTSCQSCFLHLQGNTLADGGPDGPGRLQAELAPFLKRCPYGIVMLEGLQDVHPDLVKVFNHALTEEGHFQHYGEVVHTWGALYMMTLQVPGDLLKPQKSEEAFQQRVKDHLVKALKAPRPSQSAASIWNADSQRDAEIFRRRIEVVVPVRQ